MRRKFEERLFLDSDNFGVGMAIKINNGANTVFVVDESEGRVAINKSSADSELDLGTGEIRAGSLNRPVGMLVLQGQGVQLGGSNPKITQDDSNGLITIEMGAATNYLVINNLPTSAPSGSGRLWNDSGTLKIT